MQRALQLLGGERRAGHPGQLGAQPLLAEAPLRPERLGDAVGDDDELLPGRTEVCSIPQAGVGGRRRAPEPRRVASVTESPSTSSGAGWPATASCTGSDGSSSIAIAATLQREAPRRASSSRLSVSRAITGSPVSAAAVRSV